VLHTKSITQALDAVRGLDPREDGVLVIDSITLLWDARLTKVGTIPLHAWATIKTLCPNCTPSERWVRSDLSPYHSLCRAA
jgi:hypothetical protein